jgi:hypothetical protein
MDLILTVSNSDLIQTITKRKSKFFSNISAEKKRIEAIQLANKNLAIEK